MKARGHLPLLSSSSGTASHPSVRRVVERLCQEGVWPARARELAARHAWPRIQRAIEYVSLRRAHSRIDNAAAYLVEVLDTATDASLEAALRKLRPPIVVTSTIRAPVVEISPAEWQRQCEQDLAVAQQRNELPEIRGSLRLLVSHHQQQGELDRAIKYQAELIRLDPHPSSVETLGELQHQAGHLDEALRAYAEAATLWEQVPDAAPVVRYLREKLRALAANR